MEIQLSNNSFFLVIFIIIISCNNDSNTSDVTSLKEVKNDKTVIDKGSFVVNSIFKDSLMMEFQVNSIDIEGKGRNLILFGVPEKGEKYHLAQWEVNSSYFHNSYKVPDSLFNEIKSLRFCLFYFDPKIGEPEITKCKSISLLHSTHSAIK